MMGGTGSRSEFEAQPDFMPDKYESGTPNTIGFAGLGAGATYLAGQTMERDSRKRRTTDTPFS